MPSPASRPAAAAEALTRVALGLILVPHGLGKLFGHDLAHTALNFRHLGWPAPLGFAVAVGCVEVFGGLALAAGLFTRAAAAAILAEMTGICALVLWPRWEWVHRGMEYPFLMGVLALSFVLRGGGAYSLDRVLARLWHAPAPTRANGPVTNVTALIDAAPFGGLQRMVLLLCGLAALLDGLDLQSIGLAAPGIIASLHVPPRAFGLVFSAALLGLMLGAFGLGPLADRIGRRAILIGASITFAVFTFATGFVASFPALLGMRFLAGIGLGGAMPSFIALGTEYAPRRLRGVAVALLWTGFPLGGVVGGLLGARLIPAFGWPSLFYVGGVLPLLLALALLALLPESIGFLVARDPGAPEIGRLLGRITGTAPPAGARFALGEASAPGMPLRQLFTDGRAGATLLLWVAFFAIFLMLVTNTAWSPILLHAVGLPVPRAALAMAAFNAGSVVGTAAAGSLIARLPPARTLALLSVASAASFALIGRAAPGFAGVAALQALSGVFLGAASSGLIALAALFYPTAGRSTGVGWAMGMGRFGSFLGPLWVAMLVGGGWAVAATYQAVAVPALVAAVCLLGLGWVRAEMVAAR